MPIIDCTSVINALGRLAEITNGTTAIILTQVITRLLAACPERTAKLALR